MTPYVFIFVAGGAVGAYLESKFSPILTAAVARIETAIATIKSKL